MKKITLLLIIFSGLLLCSCDPKIYFDKKEYKVRSVENGNTIVLDNFLKVKLLGIKNTPQSEEFLKQELVGKQVRLTADSHHKNYYKSPSKETIYAHVCLVDGSFRGQNLNGYVLKNGFAKFSSTPTCDSLKVYKQYSEWEPDVVLTDEQLCLKMTPATFLITSDVGIGTGFFISEDGLALTNNHVISDINREDLYRVYLSDEHGNISQSNNRKVSRIIYTDPDNDFTIFRVQLDPEEKAPCLFVARREPTRGEHVGVVGNPRGLLATFSTGEFASFREPHLIQFTAPVYPGNSGGPICNKYGIVIGIVQSVAAESDGRISTGNLNFGVDIRYVREKLNSINDIKTYCGK